MQGRLPDGSVATVEIAAPGSPAANPAFDVTPSAPRHRLHHRARHRRRDARGIAVALSREVEAARMSPGKKKRAKPPRARQPRAAPSSIRPRHERDGLSPNRSGNVSAVGARACSSRPRASPSARDLGTSDIVRVEADGSLKGKQKQAF